MLSLSLIIHFLFSFSNTTVAQYVAPIERIALRRYVDDIGGVVSALCATTHETGDDLKIALAAMQTSANDARNRNDACVRVSVHLCVLFCTAAAAACFLARRAGPPPPQVRTLSRQARHATLTLLVIGVYEYLFFDTVVREYDPLSTVGAVTRVVASCSSSSS